MIFLYIVALAVGFSLLVKKSVWNILGANFRWFYLVFVPFGLELLAVFGNVGIFSAFLTGTAYVMLAFFCLINWKIKGLPVVSIGEILNSIVVLSNGGKMPVSQATLVKAGLPPTLMDAKHVLMGPNTILPFLGDVIPVNFLGLHYACSVGDLFVYTGLFLMIYLNAPNRRRFA